MTDGRESASLSGGLQQVLVAAGVDDGRRRRRLRRRRARGVAVETGHGGWSGGRRVMVVAEWQRRVGGAGVLAQVGRLALAGRRRAGAAARRHVQVVTGVRVDRTRPRHRLQPTHSSTATEEHRTLRPRPSNKR